MESRPTRFRPKLLFQGFGCGERLRSGAYALNGDAVNICESQIHSVDCVGEFGCHPFFFPNHGKPPGYVVFDVSRPAIQRVLKFPFVTRRLNASSQLNGILSRFSARGASRRSLSPLTTDDGVGTALHRSSNDEVESRSALWMRFEESDAEVRRAESTLSFTVMLSVVTVPSARMVQAMAKLTMIEVFL
jgi:hypothetical protein